MKPTGLPHWGNYFGMIEPAIELTRDCESFYFVADYHALTTVRDAEALRQDSRGVAATLIACGLDPEHSVIWRQSDVPEVLELTWILSCVTGYGLMERAHAFKDARAHDREVNFGVVSYPALMAADILLFDSDVVPVGRDQVQHLEMARDMAGYTNVQFFKTLGVDDEGNWDGRSLKRPEALVQKQAAIVPGLDGQKMSKSYDNHIPVFASKKQLRKRIMAIKTDSTPLEEPKDPETCSVYELYCLFADETQRQEMAANYRGGGYGYGHAKLALLDLALQRFAPMRDRFDELMADGDGLEAILQQGAERAGVGGRGGLDRVRDATGLPPRPLR